MSTAHLSLPWSKGRKSLGSPDTNLVPPVVSATCLKPRHWALRVLGSNSQLSGGGLYTKTCRADIIISYSEKEPKALCITKHKGHGIFIVFNGS